MQETGSEQPKQFLPCSYNECTKAHRWPVELAISQCSGCNSQMIARRLTNCPYCNEPAEKIILRLDHLANAAEVKKACKGEPVPTWSGTIEIMRKPMPDEQGVLF